MENPDDLTAETAISSCIATADLSETVARIGNYASDNGNILLEEKPEDPSSGNFFFGVLIIEMYQ